VVEDDLFATRNLIGWLINCMEIGTDVSLLNMEMRKWVTKLGENFPDLHLYRCWVDETFESGRKLSPSARKRIELGVNQKIIYCKSTPI
jgi:hypothetical protein